MYKNFRTFLYSENTFHSTSRDLIVEGMIEILINGKRYTAIMFTPDMQQELVTGFLYTEGVIGKPGDIMSCRIYSIERRRGEDLYRAEVTIPFERARAYSLIEGKRISFSSCGICGTETYEQLQRGLKRVSSRTRFSMEVIEGLPDALGRHQPLYSRTGGAHAALLFDASGNLVAGAEDMGRHNALDKVIGVMLLKGIPPDDKILLTSGRASLEMILKTARAGFPLFVAISRPTSRAVEAAKYYNVTLMDLAKDSNQIYAHARRIEGF